MTRVDDLQKKYPSIPRETIIKMEAVTLGIRDSGVIDKISPWLRSAGRGSYASYDHDVTLKDVAEKRPGAGLKPGYVKGVGDFYLANGWGARIQRDSKSPYQIREVSEGKYGLFEGEERVEDVYFPDKPWPYPAREEPLTSKGNPITTLVHTRGPNCFKIGLVRHCAYFSTGEQCKFCNYNPSQEDIRSVGGARSATINLDETIEAYKILSSEVRLFEGDVVQGSLGDLDKDNQLHLRLVEKISGAASYKPVFTLVAQPPRTRKGLQRWKDAGLDWWLGDIEVWDRQLFEEICPGKARCVGYDRYLEAYLEAVDIFGWGRVGAAVVPGVTLMPANGHKTWQESRDVINDAIRWMTKNGVMPWLMTFHPAPGSEFYKDPTSHDRVPPTEYHLDNILVHHQGMKENGIYEKMYKFMACPFDCLSNHYFAELGMFEVTGGNASKWVADEIPDELNWLARFVESNNTTAAAK